ncbi:MAG TPA: F0F1 ATP synthase subunit A [Stellaceae bacterium]|nr:F0F1 ATP synthase subunit A [Stellaceae bacterium]
MAAAESNPLHQFTIERIVPIRIGGIDASFTNSAAFMVAAVVLIAGYLLVTTRGAQLVPGRLQSITEIFYETIAKMIDEYVGHGGERYFPFVFSLFMFILMGNLLGMIPYSFTFTSHIIVTFAMAAVVFIGVTIIGIARHGFHFPQLFVPDGVPWWLLPLLVVIELISYFIRPFTLSIRLFANMVAGHAMLAIFAGFVVSLGLFGFLPLAVTTALIFLEFLVAALQAYVFAVLTCLYLRDALHLH